MQDHEVIKILQNRLNFSPKTISDIKIFTDDLLKANKKHNFISRSTENDVWHRHILDSAQLVKFIDCLILPIFLLKRIIPHGLYFFKNSISFFDKTLPFTPHINDLWFLIIIIKKFPK